VRSPPGCLSCPCPRTLGYLGAKGRVRLVAEPACTSIFSKRKAHFTLCDPRDARHSLKRGFRQIEGAQSRSPEAAAPSSVECPLARRERCAFSYHFSPWSSRRSSRVSPRSPLVAHPAGPLSTARRGTLTLRGTVITGPGVMRSTRAPRP